MSLWLKVRPSHVPLVETLCEDTGFLGEQCTSMSEPAVTLFNLHLFVYGDHPHTWGYTHRVGSASVVVPTLHKKTYFKLWLRVF